MNREFIYRAKGSKTDSTLRVGIFTYWKSIETSDISSGIYKINN